MKKVILSLLLLGTLAACKKETAVTEEQTTETADSVVAAPAAASSVSLTEINNEQLAGLMKVQQNDTVYVTNFFATWCRPCMAEIPHFKEKLEATKDQKIKFTFVSVDPREDWESKVKPFGENFGITSHIVLYDTAHLTPNFFQQNAEDWDGNSIPFTLITKGDQRIETIGMMSKEDLDAKLASLK